MTIASKIMTAMITGKIDQKHHRHEACWVTATPISGPMPLPIATMAPMKPLYFPLCSRVVISLETIMTKAVLLECKPLLKAVGRRREAIIKTETYMAPPPSVIEAYMTGMHNIFIMYAPVIGLCCICGLFINDDGVAEKDNKIAMDKRQEVT